MRAVDDARACAQRIPARATTPAARAAPYTPAEADRPGAENSISNRVRVYATPPRQMLSRADTGLATVTVLKTNAMPELAATVRRISQEVTVTSVVPNVVMTEQAK